MIIYLQGKYTVLVEEDAQEKGLKRVSTSITAAPIEFTAFHFLLNVENEA